MIETKLPTLAEIQVHQKKKEPKPGSIHKAPNDQKPHMMQWPIGATDSCNGAVKGSTVVGKSFDSLSGNTLLPGECCG